ncbi:hypothetical protein [Robertmurraya korlensis]|nr:hypothetical protein [Robertmurraya korlensis]
MTKENNEYKSLLSIREENEQKLELSSTGYGLVSTTDEPEKNHQNDQNHN